MLRLSKYHATCALLFAALATHAQTFTNAGLTLHYTTQGKGSPVVLLSGGPGMDAAYMQPVADILARDHTAILLSQRGTTGSMPAVSDATTITPELYLSDLEALRTALGYKQWIVLGHSAGSTTAMAYAIAHPDHVAALVLLGAVPPSSAGLGRMEDNLKPRFTPDDLKQIAALEADKTLTTDARMLAENNIYFAADFYDRALVPQFLATQKPGSFHLKTVMLLMKAMPSFDYTAGLAKLHIPTLIVQGRQDPIDPEMAAEVRDAIPGAKLVIVERAGHFSWIENPKAFTAALDEFLKGLP